MASRRHATLDTTRVTKTATAPSYFPYAWVEHLNWLCSHGANSSDNVCIFCIWLNSVSQYFFDISIIEIVRAAVRSLTFWIIIFVTHATTCMHAGTSRVLWFHITDITTPLIHCRERDAVREQKSPHTNGWYFALGITQAQFYRNDIRKTGLFSICNYI